MKNPVKCMLAKHKRPYWTPLPTDRYITDWQGQIAHYNLYYVLQGRPGQQVAGDLKRNKAVLMFAIAIANSSSPSSKVADSIMMMSPEEFYRYEVLAYPKFYRKFLPLA